MEAARPRSRNPFPPGAVCSRAGGAKLGFATAAKRIEEGGRGEVRGGNHYRPGRGGAVRSRDETGCGGGGGSWNLGEWIDREKRSSRVSTVAPSSLAGLNSSAEQGGIDGGDELWLCVEIRARRTF
jgi:hypothetical protein